MKQQVNNLDSARRSREAQAQADNSFYDEQAKAEAQWSWGEKPPRGLVLGSLPYVNRKQIRLDTE